MWFKCASMAPNSSKLGGSPSPKPKAKNLIAFFASPSPRGAPGEDGFRHREPVEDQSEEVGRAAVEKAASVAREARDTQDKAREEQAGKRAKVKEEPEGGIKDPIYKIRGKMKTVNKGGRLKTGKKTGKWGGLKSNRRELGAPVLRRDPTAFEKLHMLQDVESKMRAEGIEKIGQFSPTSRQALEVKLQNK